MELIGESSYLLGFQICLQFLSKYTNRMINIYFCLDTIIISNLGEGFDNNKYGIEIMMFMQFS